MTDRSSTVGSLGAFLRHERERRGVTVEQVVSATKISVKMIHALENDQYADLPAKPFIRGFVVSYCRFLGIPSHEVLTRFAPYLEERAQERPKRDTGHSGYAFEKKEGDGGRTGLWILMGTMLVGGALMIAIFKPTLKRHRKSHVEKLQLANPPQPIVSETKGSPPVADLPAPSIEKTPIPALVSSVQVKGPVTPALATPASV
ncbi:helix-turn-helix domain-containing protein, partial [bacterium]|nr:helix-turn-helix domain-containing protein [bacterium]